MEESIMSLCYKYPIPSMDGDTPIERTSYPYGSLGGDSRAVWLGPPDAMESNFIPGNDFPILPDTPGRNNMPRSLLKQQMPVFTSEILPTYPRTAVEQYRLDITPVYESPSPYPLLNAKTTGSPNSWYENQSATEQCPSSSASVWSPASSDTEVGWGSVPPAPVFECKAELEPQLLGCGSFRPGYSSSYQGQGRHLKVPTGAPCVNPRQVQQYPDSAEDSILGDGSHDLVKLEYSPVMSLSRSLDLACDRLDVAQVQSDDLGAVVHDDAANGIVKSETADRTDRSTRQGYSGRRGSRKPKVNKRLGSPRSKLEKPCKVTKGSHTRGELSCLEHDKVFKNPSEQKYGSSGPRHVCFLLGILIMERCYRKHLQAKHTRPFPCIFAPYGCESRFGSKNEWKRHVNSQHLCPGFYRCNIGHCRDDPSRPNDFNRKDLFTQHLRRMHCPVKRDEHNPTYRRWNANLGALTDTCYISKRAPPPQSCCPFCPKTFEGDGSWEDRMEHVGRHLEKAEQECGKEDELLRAWLVRERLIVPSAHRRGWTMVGKGQGDHDEGVDADESELDAEGEEVGVE